ncbi:MAG: tyrosine-type recombinase/integrase [Methermicoccaceae archaeon]
MLDEYGATYRPLTSRAFRDIQIPPPPREKVSEEDIITYGDWEFLIRHVRSWRDKLIMAALYEGGVRCGELIGTRIGDWVLGEGFVECYIRQSETQSRKTCPMGVAKYYFTMYLQHEHPDRTNPEAPMFVSLGPNTRGRPLTEGGLNTLFNRLNHDPEVQRALGKKITPHMFRRGWVFHMIKGEKGSDHQIKEWGGWKQGNKILDDMHQLVDMARKGEAQEDEKEKTPQNRECLGCGTVNPANALFCMQCGTALSYQAIETVRERERAADKLASILPQLDPDTLRLLAENVQLLTGGGGEGAEKVARRGKDGD